MEKLSLNNQNIEFVTSNKTDFIDPDGFSKIPKMQNPPPPPPLTDEGRAWERYHNEYRYQNHYKLKKYEVIEQVAKYLSLAIILASLFYAIK